MTRVLTAALGALLAVTALAAPAAGRERQAAESRNDVVRGRLAPVLEPDADFPPADAGYHTYDEMLAEINGLADRHPGIVRVLRIGTSYEGRGIWALKISDAVAVDEAEPEVLFDSAHHAREHLTVEQALFVANLLADSYGGTSELGLRVTRLVDSREIWIIPMLNPDGAEYDLTGDPYRSWRKNRQPTPGSTYIGTDLNRNYGYRWGCCGGSSGNPASIVYRGPAAWSAPEVRAMRDFVKSRRIGDRQQIRAHITFHAYGELVLYPYGYTEASLPPDMTRDDQAVFVQLADAMAASNGYRAMQSSNLYVTDGDQIDWMYATQRIFTFTFELYPSGGSKDGFYPPDEVIAAETARNREAVLYLIENAACPYRVIGKAVTRCGPIWDDFEISRGWVVDPAGTDTATSGRWQRANPQPTATSGGPKQLDTTPSGRAAFVTGAARGSGTSANDLDGGSTTVLSPSISLTGGLRYRLSYRSYLAHDASSGRADALRVWAVSAAGVRTLVDEQLGVAADVDALYRQRTVSLDTFAGQTIRLLIEATDAGSPSLLEAAVDDLFVRAD